MKVYIFTARTMEQKKVAIGIELETHLKKSITRAIQPWRDLPIKWHPMEGLHIALLPIGWIGEDDILRIIGSLAQITQDTQSFSVAFSRIVSASKDRRNTDPRHHQMVRVEGEDNESLRELYHKICAALDIPDSSKKHFAPHVTVGRMRARKWEMLEAIPTMEKKFPALMDVTHVTLFEQINRDDQWLFEPIEIFELQ